MQQHANKSLQKQLMVSILSLICEFTLVLAL